MKKILLLSVAVFALNATSATKAHAWPFGKKTEKTEAVTPMRAPLTPPIKAPGESETEINAQKNADKPAPPASAQERADAKKLDIVSQARFWLSEFIKNPKDEEAGVYAAKTLSTIGSEDRAIEVAATALQTNDKNPALWAALGNSLLKQNRTTEAIQALQKSLTLAPNEIGPRVSLGIAYDNFERYDLAIAAYKDALLYSPNDPVVLTNLGLSYALSGNLPMAEQTLKLANSIVGAPIQARQNLALVIGLQGRLLESEKLAAQDLPPEIAKKNIDYLKTMLAKPADRWNGVDKISQNN